MSDPPDPVWLSELTPVHLHLADLERRLTSGDPAAARRGREAEDALLRFQQRLTLHFEQTPLGVIEWNPAGQITAWNPAAVRIFGWDHSEVLGRTGLSLLVPPERAAEAEACWRDLLAGRPRNIAAVNRTKYGRAIHCQWYHTPLIDHAGRVLGVASLVEDVTERRRAAEEEQLRQSEARFRTLADTAPVLIWMADPNLNRTFVNRTGLDLLGLTLEKFLGTNWRHAVHPDDLPGVIESGREVLTERRPYEREMRLRVADGSYRWFLDRGVPRVQPDGTVLGFVGSCTDITAAKQLEEERRQHQNDLANKARRSMLGEMTSGLAHELNQPLAAMLNYARGSVRRLAAGADPQELTEALNRAVAEAERAADIVRRLRQFVRRGQTSPAPTDLNRLVAAATRAVTAKDAELRLDLIDGLPPVTLDPVEIELVLLNLVRNALDAMDGAPAPHRVTVRTGADPGGVWVEVADTGPGLPAGWADYLFTPFFTTKPDGMGLGLVISQSIVEAHGGRLEARPGPDRGACFRFHLPTTESPK